MIGERSSFPARTSIDLSIIAPAHNEEGNIVRLVSDVRGAMEGSGIAFELIVVDDGSTDGTNRLLRQQAVAHPWVSVYRMLETPPGRGHGQSAAFFAGIRRARGGLIALIDADCQNDPNDLPAMVRLLRDREADMVQGDRSAARADNLSRRFSSWVGRTFRRALLGDTIRDTGCSLRVMRSALALELPLQYRGVHRFIPFYARTLGFTVIETPVRHRPRVAGDAKYGMWNRALPGFRDLLAVRWMRSRLRPVGCEPVEREAPAPKVYETTDGHR
jgi:dolichol-phosphate mannosyltransferase